MSDELPEFDRNLRSAVKAVHSHCGVYTRAEVASVLLDMVGWTADSLTINARLLEPATGEGALLLPAVERLLTWFAAKELPRERLLGMVRAYEFDGETVSKCRAELLSTLERHGFAEAEADNLARSWLRRDDFLLDEDLGFYTHVVGNPPYMRWSLIPATLRERYEAELPRSFARGDLCLAFIGKASSLLRGPGSRLAFLCADRWLRCGYGRDARAEIADAAGLVAHIDAHDAPLFANRTRVGAYAAITILERAHAADCLIASASSTEELVTIAAELSGRNSRTAPVAGRTTSVWPKGGSESARLGTDAVRDAFAGLTDGKPTLAEVGIQVRCGLALGCADVFVVDEGFPVEADRTAAWIRPSDLSPDGTVCRSKLVLNVWDECGKLVDLRRFPRLAAHLEKHRDRLAKRACATKPEWWYRTIDRLTPSYASERRVLIAGMSKRARVGVAEIGEVPSNALYTLRSSTWPVEALANILRAGLLDVYGEVLSPRFAGGTKRFDGNILRQIRLPSWSEVDQDHKRRLEARSSTDGHDTALLCDMFAIRASARRKALESALQPYATARLGTGQL